MLQLDVAAVRREGVGVHRYGDRGAGCGVLNVIGFLRFGAVLVNPGAEVGDGEIGGVVHQIAVAAESAVHVDRDEGAFFRIDGVLRVQTNGHGAGDGLYAAQILAHCHALDLLGHDQSLVCGNGRFFRGDGRSALLSRFLCREIHGKNIAAAQKHSRADENCTQQDHDANEREI